MFIRNSLKTPTPFIESALWTGESSVRGGLAIKPLPGAVYLIVKGDLLADSR